MDGNIKIEKQYIHLQEARSKCKKYTYTFCVLKYYITYIYNTFSQTNSFLTNQDIINAYESETWKYTTLEYLNHTKIVPEFAVSYV